MADSTFDTGGSSPQFIGVTLTGPMIYSTANGLTAHAGGGQGSATAIIADINRFTTVASVADSAVLPANAAGRAITVSNAAGNSMNVFPATGEQVNGAGANVAYALAAGKSAEFTCAVNGLWHAVLSA